MEYTRVKWRGYILSFERVFPELNPERTHCCLVYIESDMLLFFFIYCTRNALFHQIILSLLSYNISRSRRILSKIKQEFLHARDIPCMITRLGTFNINFTHNTFPDIAWRRYIFTVLFSWFFTSSIKKGISYISFFFWLFSSFTCFLQSLFASYRYNLHKTCQFPHEPV